MPILEVFRHATSFRRRDTRQTLVTQDPKQPGPRFANLLAFHQHAVRRQECRLHCIFGVLKPPKTMPRESQEFGAVCTIESSGTSALVGAR